MGESEVVNKHAQRTITVNENCVAVLTSSITDFSNKLQMLFNNMVNFSYYTGNFAAFY